MYKGIYGNHLGGRAFTYKTLWQGYYWSIMMEDAKLKKKLLKCYVLDLPKLAKLSLVLLRPPQLKGLLGGEEEVTSANPWLPTQWVKEEASNLDTSSSAASLFGIAKRSRSRTRRKLFCFQPWMEEGLLGKISLALPDREIAPSRLGGMLLEDK